MPPSVKSRMTLHDFTEGAFFKYVGKIVMSGSSFSFEENRLKCRFVSPAQVITDQLLRPYPVVALDAEALFM